MVAAAAASDESLVAPASLRFEASPTIAGAIDGGGVFLDVVDVESVVVNGSSTALKRAAALVTDDVPLSRA